MSKLSLLFKLIKKPICNQLKKYLFYHNIYAKCQSAFHVGHSTVTAMLCKHNDVMCSLDEQRDAIFIMLDLSAAFNTTGHDILLHRLQTKFGINRTALDWLSSYLNCRTQHAVVWTAMSDPSPIYCGVPRGSVLRPVLFCMYTMPLEDIIFYHGLQYMMYADDIQVCITCDGDQVPTGTIEECVGEIHNWMRTNMLALKDRSDSFLY